jgi:serine/threonine-protein kinase
VLGSVGPYEIVDKLGAGGMGEVFLGHDPRLQRRVALKRLTAAASGGADENARVLREARAVARLNHPNIAAVYDVLQQDDRTFIVMEYVEGESLSARMARERIPIVQVRLIGRQLASALAAAHAQGVIHRDLKPANIHLTPDGSIKVLDFGVAKVSRSAVGTPTATDDAFNEHTIAGNPGTPIYMSPEQLFSRPLDERSDIYSAGVILFQMATGRRPYEQLNAVGLALAMSTTPAPPAHSIDADIPDDLNDAIARALERDPDHRFQSAAELELALSGVGDVVGKSVRSTRATLALASVRQSRRVFVTAAAIISLLAAGVTAWRPLWARLGLGPPSPASIAILPVDNPAGDPRGAALGAAFASVVADNLRDVNGISVVPRESVAPFASRRSDAAAIKRDSGADYVIDLTVKSAAPKAEITVRVRRADSSTAEWEQTIAGTPVEIEDALLDRIARTLGRRGDDAARIRRLPTRNDEAIRAYTDALALLNRSDVVANVDRAIEQLQRAVDADHGFAPAHAALGSALLMRYERTRDGALVERATSAITEALRIDPELSAGQTAFAYLQAVTGRRDAAAASFRRAIELDPDNDDAHRLLGLRVLMTQRRMDEAIAELRHAVRIRPDSFENHFRLGNVLYYAGQYLEAVDEYRHATEIQPTRADVYTNLGVTYVMLADMDQAIGNFEHAMSLGAGDALAWGNLAIAYFFRARYEDALAAALEAVKRDPRRASLQRDLGDYYKMLGKRREAEAAYGRAIALARQSVAVNPRDAASVMTIALCEANLGRRVKAERHAAEALTLSPDDRDLLIRAVKVSTILGDERAALERLRKAIDRGYNPQLVRDDPELASLKPLPGFEAAIADPSRAQGVPR